MRTSKPISVAHCVDHTLNRLTIPGPAANQPAKPKRQLRRSQTEIDRWIPSEIRARVIALAAEFGWDVTRVISLAVNLFTVQTRDPQKRQALMDTLKPREK